MIMYQIPTKKWNCEIRDTKGEKKIPSFPLTDMAILWEKKKKNLGTGVTHKENRRKKEKKKKNGWKLYRTSKNPTRLPDRIPQEREGGKMQSFPEQETGEAARNEAEPNTRYPRQRHHQPVDRPDSGKEDPHISIRLATYTSARATATSGARAGELMIGEVEPAELERIRGEKQLRASIRRRGGWDRKGRLRILDFSGRGGRWMTARGFNGFRSVGRGGWR